MAIQFSAEGPAFPEDLVEAFIRGEAVFLCGAGVSAPQLPLFAPLVKKTLGALGLEMTASEDQSFNEGRFEEVLGSIGRRIVDPEEMIKKVIDLLSPPAEPDLANHKTILRLSRDLENRPSIVTTNFDNLIEYAFRESEDEEVVRKLSYAGQGLPPPGSSNFGGIIHLHGRIADDALQLERTPLVLTSADYGDAYMRSGWASRFLFDLSRCRTIVLVGYRAGDAPVRYFLNVLEADRERFKDLRPVYALDGVEDKTTEDSRWEAVAVTPVHYEYKVDPETGNQDHGALWRDLAELAELVERPKPNRRRWAAEILAKPLSETTDAEQAKICWLFSGMRDLDSVAIETVEDPNWFDFLAERARLEGRSAVWVVSAWCARNWTDPDRYKVAITWLNKIGHDFADEVGRRIGQADEVPEFWQRAWRLLTISGEKAPPDWDDNSYALRKIFERPVILDDDLRRAVELLTPVLKIERKLHGPKDEEVAEITRLAELAWYRIALQQEGEDDELIEALLKLERPIELLGMATNALRAVASLSVDADLIGPGYDISEYSVPSVEPHEQNEHHDGPVQLVTLIAKLLPGASEIDGAATRATAEAWRTIPGFLGHRLWMHALRQPLLYSSDDALTGLAALSDGIFWEGRREFALVIRDRADGATPAVREALQSRIIDTSDAHFAQYEIEAGQVDWRSHARDLHVWLRLKMFEEAGVLSDAGGIELASVVARRDYLARAAEERDLFGVYSTGMRMVAGDPAEVEAAGDEDRLQVAKEVLNSPDIERQQGWRQFCSINPEGAFETLTGGALDEANRPLWHDFITVLAFPDEGDPANVDLIRRTFEHLQGAGDPFVTALCGDLANLYSRAPRIGEPIIDAWSERLIICAILEDGGAFNDSEDLMFQAVNSTVGRLTSAVLRDIERHRKADDAVPDALPQRLMQLGGGPGRSGIYASATMVREIGFVLALEKPDINAILEIALTGDEAEKKAVRSILMSYSSISSAASRLFAEQICRAAIEFGGTTEAAKAASSKILGPAVSVLRGEQTADYWGLTIEDAKTVLRKSSGSLRIGAAALLRQWVSRLDGGADANWMGSIGPLLDQAWPRERALQESGCGRHFADLALATDDAFPVALTQLLPYVGPYHGHHGIYAFTKATAPEKHPRDALKLLWRVLGPGSDANRHGVDKIIDRLVVALPAIELDRRLQWLEQRASRAS